MLETLTVADAVELAVVERSGFVESRHAGAAVGQAHVVMAYARYPLIGGARAQYPEAIR